MVQSTDTFYCSQCGHDKPVSISGGTGYAVDNSDQKICYDCCAVRDRADMVETGRATLYLTTENVWRNLPSSVARREALTSMRQSTGTVGNWPGTLSFRCIAKIGNHNIAGTRYDVWFTGPDGFQWHGVQYGENTQICHCRRTKTRA